MRDHVSSVPCQSMTPQPPWVTTPLATGALPLRAVGRGAGDRSQSTQLFLIRGYEFQRVLLNRGTVYLLPQFVVVMTTLKGFQGGTL